MTIEEMELEKVRRLPRRQLVDEWSVKFDSVRYPIDFYLQMLRAVQSASDEQQLHCCVVRLLAWKDGKVREEPTGTLKVGGRPYSVRKTKPNIYAPGTHDRKLLNRQFYDWSKSVMILKRFSTEHLTTIKERFELWPTSQSLVMPAFLLHILNPRVFPIFDQHVERARRFLGALALNSGSADISLDDYVAYHDFWIDWTGDLGIDLSCAGHAQIKQVDDALWSIGERLSQSKAVGSPGRSTGTSSPEFINRVFSYLRSMTQAQAMARAAENLGVTLPRSYLEYPASHIHRWRRQGYPRRS